jgi:hypothetical protein
VSAIEPWLITAMQTDPVKVKVFGLVPVTKMAYLAIQACVFSLLIAALVIVLAFPPEAQVMRLNLESNRELARADSVLLEVGVEIALFGIALLDWAVWILAAILALEVIETAVVLRKFRLAEERRQAEASRRRS